VWYLKVGDKIFEGVSSFRYLGNVIDKEGRIGECIKDRIQAWNKAYAANCHMLKSKIIKRTVKCKYTYKTVIRPVTTCGSETWTLTRSDENSRIFERKILRKIYGSVQEGDTWRIKQIYKGGRYCDLHKSAKDKMAGPCEQNGSWGNAKKNDGRKTVYRKKERKGPV
jgi:hypothetical protein